MLSVMPAASTTSATRSSRRCPYQDQKRRVMNQTLQVVASQRLEPIAAPDDNAGDSRVDQQAGR